MNTLSIPTTISTTALFDLILAWPPAQMKPRRARAIRQH